MEKVRSRIPKSVYLLGMVSFFNDIASEMVYPVMPIFLTQILGAPVYIVGIIDGVAEGMSSLLKTVFGYWSDKVQRRKPFVVTGYTASAISKVFIALASTWPLVFLARIVDRFGKGVRTGARDALLLDASDDTNKGFIFGVHRSFDSAGAVVGPLIALLLIHSFAGNIRYVLYAAAIPSFFGLFFFIFIREARKRTRVTSENFTLTFSFRTMPSQFKSFLLVMTLFTLGNSSDSFLILQSKQLGLSLTAVVFAYVFYNVVYTLLSTPAGMVADKIGARYVYAAGLVIYALVYIGFALNQNTQMIWVLFAVYGAYIALTDGVSKALIGSFISKDQAGTMYGMTQTIVSVATLLASVIGGALWTTIGSQATFLFGASCAMLAFLCYLPLMKKKV